MTRILLLTHEFAPFRGGVASVAHGLAQGALALGFEPVVFAPDYHADQSAEDAARPYEVVRFPGDFCSVVSFSKVVAFTRACARALRELRADRVHGVDPPAQMALSALSRLGRVSDYLLTVHGTELLRYKGEALPRLWMAGGFRRAAAVAVVSAAVRERLHRDFRVSRERTFVSHPGLGEDWLEGPPTERSALRAEWGAGPEDFVVITVGRRVYEKGQDRVVEGLARLPGSERGRTLYVVVGTGPDAYARELRARADSAAVRLIAPGPLMDAEVIRACDAADLFAMLPRQTPKRLEGLGLAYLEAGARGLPSLACATGGVAEAVKDGETGLLVEADAGPDAVAEAVALLMKDRALRRRLGDGAREHAGRFTHVRHAREVYGRFVEARGH